MAAALLRTPLHDWHAAHGGRLVEFAGWSMPVQYSTIVEEHRAVRERVGLFDISHMGRLTFRGGEALPWLETVTTNHVAKLAEGQIQYSLMANEAGGLIDDVLVYRLPFSYAMVCNASNRAAVLAQLERHRPPSGAELADRTTGTAMIAVQGPKALETLQPLFGSPLDPLPYYHATQGRLLGSVDAVVSRTGYTGEDGFELMVGVANGVEVWQALLESGRNLGIAPCGLGARDTLRFEAGMPLFGHEMDETVNPYAAGLGWAVKLGKGEFVGREALRRFKSNPGRARVGLELAGKRPARQGCPVLRDVQGVGHVTSGTFSPTLGKSLAMALVEPAASPVGTSLTVDVRGHHEPAEVVPLPFYRRPHPSNPTSSS
jgi:aminomethyltransferase